LLIQTHHDYGRKGGCVDAQVLEKVELAQDVVHNVPLFEGILMDLFLGVELPPFDYMIS
jgi:hypothetical protein